MESDKELPTLGAKRLTTCSERKRKGGGTSVVYLHVIATQNEIQSFHFFTNFQLTES